MSKVAATPAAVSTTPEELAAAVDAERVERRRREWTRVAALVGVRYAGCTIDGYRADTDAQRSIVESVRSYCDGIAQNARAGRNVMLYGPPGTGKDHLAVVVMRAAVNADLTVGWADGADFYGGNRDAIDGDKSESSLLEKFRRPDLLVLSDPVPPLGAVESPYQLSMLFRVIDRRYRDMKPTVMTINVASRTEAEKRLSPNIIDRLAHGALALHCNWQSFRRR